MYCLAQFMSTEDDCFHLKFLFGALCNSRSLSLAMNPMVIRIMHHAVGQIIDWGKIRSLVTNPAYNPLLVTVLPGILGPLIS